MSDDLAARQQSSQPQATIRSPEHKIIYADSFSIKVTPVDFSMTFAVQNAMPFFNPNTGTSTVINVMIEQFTVAMPLPSFKLLAEHMAQVVGVIESEIGHIRTPSTAKLTPEHLETIRHNFRINPLA
jgi:hypothetical protein